MANIDQEISITYGSTVLGGSTNRDIDSKVQKLQITKDYESFEIVALFVTSGHVSDAAFNTEITALEAAFKDIDQTITVAHNAETWYSFSPAANTGFNTRATIRKVGDDADTVRSRAYTITLTAELPADRSGRAGRRSSQVNIDLTPGKVITVEITGVYTALSGNSSLDQYDASIAAYSAAVLTVVKSSATFDLIEESKNHDDQNKVITFRQVYEELIFDESQGTLDDLQIKNQTLNVSRLTEAPGDSPAAFAQIRHLETLTVEYESEIDQTVTKDIRSVWENTIRPYIVQVIQDTAEGGLIAITELVPTFHYADNKITATGTAIAQAGSELLEFNRTDELDDERGVVIRKVHTGNPRAAYEWQGPGALTLTTTWTGKTTQAVSRTQLKNEGIAAITGEPVVVEQIIPIEGRLGGLNNSGQSGFRLLRRTPRVTQKNIGTEDAEFFVTEFELVEISEFIEGFAITFTPA